MANLLDAIDERVVRAAARANSCCRVCTSGCSPATDPATIRAPDSPRAPGSPAATSKLFDRLWQGVTAEYDALQ